MHRLVELARRAVEECVLRGRALSVPEDMDGELRQKAGVFVCIKRGGQLRGCIGTIRPATDSVASETIANAISAATGDPRFYPVSEDELRELEYSVDVLCAPEPVRDVSELDPKKYGVIVSKGPRKGLLLPDLDGVDTVEQQLRIAKTKAGIAPDDGEVAIERFEVKRFK